MSLDEIANKLGAQFAVAGELILHEPTGTLFALIPGGTFMMGFTADDIRSVWCAVDESSNIAHYVERSRPAHAVTLKPFLMAQSLATGEAKAHGFRLPTEAEWEWMAREGGAVRFTGVPRSAHPLTPANAEGSQDAGPNAFGIQDLHETSGELVSDSRHDDYVGAPSDGSSWGDGAGVARWGHIWWQDEIEVLSLHAAIRNAPEEDVRHRFVLDVPGAKAPAPKKIAWAATMSETLAGFTAPDPLPSIRTLETLLSITVRDDTRALLSALRPVLAKMEHGRDDALRVLADAAAKHEAVRALIAEYKLLDVPSEPKAPLGPVVSAAPQSGMASRTCDRRNCAADALGPKTKKERWTTKFSRPITGAAIAADGTVFVGVQDGRLCAVSKKDGKTLWSFRGKGDVVSTPALGPEGSVWFATTAGMIYGLPTNGDETHLVKLDESEPIVGALAIVDHTLVATTTKGTVVAVRAGAIAWRRELAASKYNVEVRFGPAAADDGTIFTWGADSELHALSPAGKRVWSRGQLGAPITAPLLGRDSTIYVIGGAHLHALGAGGAPRWSKPLEEIDENLWGSMGGLAQDLDGNLYLSSMGSDACVHVLSEKDGKPLRTLQANNWIHAPATTDSDRVAYFGSLMNVYAYSKNGKQLWNARINGRVTGPLALGTDGGLYASTDKGFLHAFG